MFFKTNAIVRVRLGGLPESSGSGSSLEPSQTQRLKTVPEEELVLGDGWEPEPEILALHDSTSPSESVRLPSFFSVATFHSASIRQTEHVVLIRHQQCMFVHNASFFD